MLCSRAPGRQQPSTGGVGDGAVSGGLPGGGQTVIRELWYVEELDVLAMALRGRTRCHRFNLTCGP